MKANAWDTIFMPGNIVDSFCRICVPLFVLISGNLLLEKEESASLFYKKRLSRILIPLVVWSILYSIYNVLWLHSNKGYWDFTAMAESMAMGKPFYHLWYLYMLLGLYVAVPLVRYVITQTTRKQLWIIAGVFVAIALASSIYDQHFKNKPFFLFWFINYLGYFILGYLIKGTKRVPLPLLGSIYILSCLLNIFISYYTAKNFKNLCFYEYASPLVVIGSLAVYKFFLQINLRENILSKIGGLTLGIYVVHAIILDLISKRFPLFLNINALKSPYAEMLIKFVLTFFVSLAIVYAISKTKWIKRII